MVQDEVGKWNLSKNKVFSEWQSFTSPAPDTETNLKKEKTEAWKFEVV